MNLSKILLISIFSLFILNSCSEKASPPEEPSVNFYFSGDGEFAPSEIQFASSTTNATSYKWDFGDNSMYSFLENTSHIYSNGGTYTVTLTATGEGGFKSISKTITILGAPTSVKIKKISIIDIPFTNSNDGSGWDESSGPDLFFKLLSPNPDNTVLAEAEVIADVVATSLPLDFSFGTYFSMPTLNEYYFIVIYDYDTGIYAPDDQIDYVAFNMSDYVTSQNLYPSTISLKSERTSLEVEVEVVWE